MIGDTKSTSTMHHVPRECATPLFLDEFIDSEYGQQKCWVVTTSWRRHDLAYGYTVSNELEVAGPQVVLHNSMEPLGIDEKLSWDEPPLGGTHACPELSTSTIESNCKFWKDIVDENGRGKCSSTTETNTGTRLQWRSRNNGTSRHRSQCPWNAFLREYEYDRVGP